MNGMNYFHYHFKYPKISSSSGNQNLRGIKFPFDIESKTIRTRTSNGEIEDLVLGFVISITGVILKIKVESIKFIFFLLCLFGALISNAQTYTFTGDGDWNNISNWDSNGIPPENSPVSIEIKGNASINDDLQLEGYLTIFNTKTLSVSSYTTFNQDFIYNQGTIVVESNYGLEMLGLPFQNYGKLVVKGSFTFTEQISSFDNFGRIDVSGYMEVGILNNLDTVLVDRDGDLVVNDLENCSYFFHEGNLSGGHILEKGSFYNYGQILGFQEINGSGSFFNHSKLTIPSVDHNNFENFDTLSTSTLNGVITNKTGGYLEISGGGTIGADITNEVGAKFYADAMLYGIVTNYGETLFSGDIDGSFNNESTGTLSPGLPDSPIGYLNINGSFYNQGALNLEIKSGSEYDFIQSTPIFTNQNEINISLIDPFLPSLNDTFSLIRYAQAYENLPILNLPIVPNFYWEVATLSGAIVLYLNSDLQNGVQSYVGIQEEEPVESLHVGKGDLFLAESASGIILKDEVGNCYRITVDTNGALQSKLVPCRIQ